MMKRDSGGGAGISSCAVGPMNAVLSFVPERPRATNFRGLQEIVGGAFVSAHVGDAAPKLGVPPLPSDTVQQYSSRPPGDEGGNESSDPSGRQRYGSSTCDAPEG